MSPAKGNYRCYNQRLLGDKSDAMSETSTCRMGWNDAMRMMRTFPQRVKYAQ